jgi:hypothetical protein
MIIVALDSVIGFGKLGSIYPCTTRDSAMMDDVLVPCRRSGEKLMK